MSKNVYFVSLGCPKNQVDTERMVALATQNNFAIAKEPDQAEVIVVNTCGFINAAKEESIETTLEMANYKHEGQCRTLVMAGCLSQRYVKDLSGELPEVDYFIGTADLGRLGDILEEKEVARNSVSTTVERSEITFERQLVGRGHSAYLKISEGCNRPCAFCAIPLIRGRQRSYPIDELYREASRLVESGVKELILVAQDSTAYGRDLGKDQNLPLLLERLNEIEGLQWIRIHYAYPTMITKDLVEAMARLEKVAPYIDMPIQHANDEVLRRMRRGYGIKHIRKAIADLREAIPNIAIRSTFLVGHPGETEEGFQELMEFINEIGFDHLGVFPFSPEDNTPAAEQPGAVDPEVAKTRAEQLMSMQSRISKEKIGKLVGQERKVMIDGMSEESEFLLQGRHTGQSPDIDGFVILANGPENVKPGDVLQARITQAHNYDLVAECIN